MPKRAWWVGAVILAALAACEKDAPPQKPQLIVDRDSIGFGQEFDRGTYVGSAPQESLYLENGGIETLVISEVTLTGDGAFTHEGPTSNEVEGLKRTFIRVIFKPTEAREYSATLKISSNAENAPVKEIAVTGLGIAKP